MLNTLNKAALGIFEQVSLYRAEMGQSLQQLVECYSVLFLKQYDVFNHTENDKEQLYNSKMAEIQ